MKLRRVLVENVRSFLEPAEILLDGDISIIPKKSATQDNPDRHEFLANDSALLAGVVKNWTAVQAHGSGDGHTDRTRSSSPELDRQQIYENTLENL